MKECARVKKRTDAHHVQGVGGRPGRAVTLACPVGRQVSRPISRRLPDASPASVHPLLGTRCPLPHLTRAPFPGDRAVT
jgi:hypothetical protein